MKVCFIVGTLGRGGAEKQLLFMLSALVNSGVETRVICLTKGEAYETKIRELGIDVEFAGSSRNQLVRVWKIVRSLRRNPADIIQSSHFYTNFYAGIAGRLLRIPSIGAIRSNVESELSSHPFLGRLLLRLPDFLIVNSLVGRQRAIDKRISDKSVALVPNTVELGLTPSEALQHPDRPTTMLFVGRLVNVKRADRFIVLAAELTVKYPKRRLNFRIAGDGPLRPKLEEQAKDLQPSFSSIEFLGEVENLDAIYRDADILVLTSDYEGTPNAVLEAMAHGVAVIATDVGGVSGVLNESCGILVEPDNPKALIDAASRLIEDADLLNKLGSNGRAYVRENHSCETLAANLTAIYNRLIKSSQSVRGDSPTLNEELL
ncbi:MAG: glycosyltransferase family 4 protein [Blastocatellia bacterium]